jgi:hypothetical protein
MADRIRVTSVMKTQDTRREPRRQQPRLQFGLGRCRRWNSVPFAVPVLNASAAAAWRSGWTRLSIGQRFWPGKAWPTTRRLNRQGH